MTIVIETPRLLLRTWKDSDFEPFSQINADPLVMEFFPALQTSEQTQTFIEKIENHYEKHGYTLYAVEIKETGAFIGFVGLYYVSFTTPFTPATEIGWRLASQYWGKGYATEAAQAVLNYGFNTLDLDEIFSFTTVKNEKSRRVMEKIGLEHNPAHDFDHPRLDPESPLLRHVTYRLSKEDFLRHMCQGTP